MSLIKKVKLPGGTIYDIGVKWENISNKPLSTDNAIARFNGSNGDIQNSGVILDDNNNITTSGHVILQKSANVTWSGNGDDNEPAVVMKGANDKDFKFKFSTSGNNVDIGWDWTLVDGSGAFFRNSDAQGSFGFFARKPNDTTPTKADCVELYGYPNGLLCWKKTTGDSNPRFAINATSTNYTLYVNGTTYLKGDTKISSNTSTNGCTLQYDNTLNTLNFVFD